VTTYITMLRGINVSGRNKLSMDDLRAMVTDIGGNDVQTYIQSGNAVFTSARSASAIVKDLERAVEESLGNRVPVLIRTRQQLADVLGSNPFLTGAEDLKILHVTFLSAVPPATALASVSGKRSDGDELRVIGREVYLSCPNGYGTTKLTNAFFEKKLGTQATTRNWTTVGKLVTLAGG
jgi:uncharacterized protein (DUF1697 family)